MAQGVSITFAPLGVLAFGAVAVGYTAIGTPFLHPVRNITITNLTNQTIRFSYDNGVTDHDILPAVAGKVYDFAANQSRVAGMAAFQAGGSVYAKIEGAVLPTSGSLYVSAFYCLGD